MNLGSISFVSWNVHGLNSINNLDTLDYLNQFDIISFVETWISNEENVDILMTGYTNYFLGSVR